MGSMISLCKKGGRSDKNTYRAVSLLAIYRTVLARVPKRRAYGVPHTWNSLMRIRRGLGVGYPPPTLCK